MTKSADFFAGMTVNERLYHADLLDDFDRAAVARDRAEMISILDKVYVGNSGETADAILDDPGKYGY